MATRLAVALESVDRQQEEEMIKLKQYGDEAPSVGLERRVVALNSYIAALESAQDSPELMQLMGVSTEGFLGKMLDSAKESLAQWTVGIRKWKAGGWDNMAPEDQLRGVKKANLLFFYYNPKYIKNLENIYRLNREVFDIIINARSEADVEKHVAKLIPEIKTIIKATGVDTKATDLTALQKEFKSTLAKYEPSEGAEGDAAAVGKIVEIVDKYKLSVSQIDALRLVSKNIGMEGIDREDAEKLGTAISWILFFTVLWPVWLIWVMGLRDITVKAVSND